MVFCARLDIKPQTIPSTICETTFRGIFNYAPESVEKEKGEHLFSNAKLESRQSNYFDLQLNLCDTLFVAATAKAATEANSFD